MGYKIKKHLTKVNKGKKGDNTPEWIIFHFVGASGQAQSNANYFYDTYRGASAHYFVDPNTIVQVVEDDTPAWHIGDGSRTRAGKNNGYVHAGGATNTNSIGVENCQDTSTGKDVWSWDFDDETLNKAEWLIHNLQKKYNIDDDHVIRHFDASTKPCPGNWKSNDWGKWWAFKDRLNKGIKQPKPSSKPKEEGKSNENGMYLVKAGDNLSSIAKKHKVTVKQMTSWNNLDDPNLIIPETKLFIKSPSSKGSGNTNIDKLAKEVIDGKHGSGESRKKSLGSNYDAVQSRVNDILTGKATAPKKTKGVEALAKEVIDGKWGSGEERKRRLGSRYSSVQKRVNELTSPKKKKKTKGVETLAKEVIAGKHGSGEDRKKSLGNMYSAVQKRVNELSESKKKTKKKSINTLLDEVNRGVHGNGAARKKSLGKDYARVQAEINRRSK